MGLASATVYRSEARSGGRGLRGRLEGFLSAKKRSMDIEMVVLLSRRVLFHTQCEV